MQVIGVKNNREVAYSKSKRSRAKSDRQQSRSANKPALVNSGVLPDSATIQIANKILGLVGPGKILYFGARDDALVCELLKNGCIAFGLSSSITRDQEKLLSGNLKTFPFDPKVFDTLIIDSSILSGHEGKLEHLIPAFRLVTNRNLIVWDNQKNKAQQWRRHDWEQLMFQAGFRKHPGNLKVSNYVTFNKQVLHELTAYEIIPDKALAKWPLRGPREKQNLHMDMLRESSCRADAYILRYALAAESIRAGDVVLNSFCGLGYGAAILAARSRAERIIGVDMHKRGIKYANDNYAGQYGIEFQKCKLTALSFLEDNSVDFIASFETIEHSPEPGKVMAEFSRVLKPDGRIIVSVPFLWTDETGNDPKPYHYQVFDHQSFAELFGPKFLIENRYIQTAPGGFKLTDSPLTLTEINENLLDMDAEWLIYKASNNPLQHSDAEYRHPAHEAATLVSGSHIMDIKTHYDNPWIYRSLVEAGVCMDKPGVVLDLLVQLICTTRTSSADRGAALYQFGCRMIEEKELSDTEDFIACTQSYLAVIEINPHVKRWQISLAFIVARIEMIRGNLEKAIEWFNKVVSIDCLEFSPILATKTLASYFWMSIICLSNDDQEQAVIYLDTAINTGKMALQSDQVNAIGELSEPFSFGFQELAEVADMSAQCVLAKKYLHLYDRAPGIFWSMVNIKSFGPATRCRRRARRELEVTESTSTKNARIQGY